MTADLLPSQGPIFMPTAMEWKHPDCLGVEVDVTTIYDSFEEADADFPITLRVFKDSSEDLNCEMATKLAHALLKAVDVLKMQCIANQAVALPAPPRAHGAPT